MQFLDIPGLNALKSQLILSYRRGKVAHAYLYAGYSGTAAFPLALAYATYLMCQSKQEHDSCGTCVNCVRMKKSIHPDVHWYFPKIAASDAGKYEKVLSEALPLWRSFIAEKPFGSFEDWARHYEQDNKHLQLSREDSRQILNDVSMRSVEGGYKIIFIWGTECMHVTGANAILKKLEEPPENTFYFLITHHYDALLPTITSRAQLITISPHSSEEIQRYLMSTTKIGESRARQLSEMAYGSIGHALRLVQNDNPLPYHLFRDWMLACWRRDFTTLIKASEEFSKTNKTYQKDFLSYALALIRSAVLKASGNFPPVSHEDEGTFISKYAQQLGNEKLEIMYNLINEAIQHLERNANPRITHLNLSLVISKKIND